MKTKVFLLKGYFCISSHPNAEGIIKTTGKGTVMLASKVQITQEAIDALMNCKRIGGSLHTNISVFKSEEGGIFAWEGSTATIILVNKLRIGKDDDPSILVPCEVDIPDHFKKLLL